jgi:hypothetical protein
LGASELLHHLGVWQGRASKQSWRF